MSIKTPDTQQSSKPNRSRPPHWTRRLIAAAAATAVTGAGVVAGVEVGKNFGDGDHDKRSTTHGMGQGKAVHHKHSGRQPSATPSPEATKTPTAVRKTVEQLPGYGMQVSAQERAKLRASTVRIAWRPKNVPGEWIDLCTGVKVSVGEETYVMTSRHCFDDSLDLNKEFPAVHSGAPHSSRWMGGQGLHQPKNVTAGLNHAFGVETVGADGVEDADHTAPVSAVVEIPFPDVALLQIDENARGAAAFDALPAIPLDSSSPAEPIPGAATTTFGLPQSAGGSLVEGPGIYYGMMADPLNPEQQVYVVGITPHDQAANACEPGGSGAGAVIAGGTVTGPLTMRYDTTNLREQNLIDSTLGLKEQAATVCTYSVVPPTAAQAMAQELASVG